MVGLAEGFHTPEWPGVGVRIHLPSSGGGGGHRSSPDDQISAADLRTR